MRAHRGSFHPFGQLPEPLQFIISQMRSELIQLVQVFAIKFHCSRIKLRIKRVIQQKLPKRSNFFLWNRIITHKI